MELTSLPQTRRVSGRDAREGLCRGARRHGPTADPPGFRYLSQEAAPAPGFHPPHEQGQDSVAGGLTRPELRPVCALDRE